MSTPRTAIAASLGAVVALALVLLPERAPVVQRATLDATTLRAWLGPGETISDQEAGARIQRDGEPECALVVVPVTQARATDSSGLNGAVRPLPSTGVACDRWQADLGHRIRAADREPASIRPGDDSPPINALGQLGLALAAALIGALLVVMMGGWLGLERGLKRQSLWIFFAALGLRLLFPDRLAMVYFGYELLGQAAHLDALPRYGPGSTALWSMMLGWLSDDHRLVQHLHDVLGAATVTVWALAAIRISGRKMTGWWIAAPLVLVPLFLRDHGSESVHIGAMWALALACYALSDRQRVTSAQLALAMAGCVLAGLFRADVAPLALATALAFRWLASGSLRELASGRRSVRLCIAAAAIGGLLLIALLVSERMARDLSRANLPQLANYPTLLPHRLLMDNVLLRAEFFPLAGWLAVLAWIAWGKATAAAHHRWLVLPLLALFWLLPYYADYNETSMLRLQVPAATLFAVGAAGLAAQLAAASGRSLMATATWAALLLGSSAYTLPGCLQTSNAHAEDSLLDEVLAALPDDRPFWLVTRSYADGETRDLHLHLPTWRFQPPWRQGRVISIRDWLRVQRAGGPPEVDAFYLQSHRCWMHRQGRGQASRLHKACRELRQGQLGAPIFQRKTANLGDFPTFNLYGSSANLEVGLWRLTNTTPIKNRPTALSF